MALRLTEPPEHIEGDDGVTFIVGVATIVIVTVFEAVHVPIVPVTVYVVVEPGLAVTTAPVVPLNPVPGLHVYVVAPDAVNVVEPPLHNVADAGVTFTVGVGLTVISTLSLLVHPAVVPVTV